MDRDGKQKSGEGKEADVNREKNKVRSRTSDRATEPKDPFDEGDNAKAE